MFLELPASSAWVLLSCLVVRTDCHLLLLDRVVSFITSFPYVWWSYSLWYRHSHRVTSLCLFYKIHDNDRPCCRGLSFLQLVVDQLKWLAESLLLMPSRWRSRGLGPRSSPGLLCLLVWGVGTPLMVLFLNLAMLASSRLRSIDFCCGVGIFSFFLLFLFLFSKGRIARGLFSFYRWCFASNSYYSWCLAPLISMLI